MTQIIQPMKNLSPNQKYTIVGILVLLLVVIPITAIVLTKNTGILPFANLPVKKPLLNFVSKQPSPSWTVYTSKSFGYSVSYPPELTVEDRGKVGNLLSLVAFNYQDGNKRITVAKMEVSTGKSPALLQTSKGKDGNGNDVAVYTFPYMKTNTLTLTGTVWPTVNSTFLFNQVLDQMAASVKVTAK